MLIVINTDSLSNDSITASGPGGWWVYTFFVILRDGKLVGREGVGWYLIKVLDVTAKKKKNSMKYFCIIREKIAYMECVIQHIVFYSFHLFLSVLLGNVDSALVSDSNAYIWILNYILNQIWIKCSNLYSSVEGICF